MKEQEEKQQAADPNYPRMRKMDIGEMISVTLPAHVWIAYWAAYSESEFNCAYASIIAIAAQEQILDPGFVQERKDNIRKEKERENSLFDMVLPSPAIRHQDQAVKESQDDMRHGYL